MVQFKTDYRKTKYPYKDNITHGSCLYKNSRNFEYIIFKNFFI